MADDVAHGGCFLAGAGIFRPVQRDRIVEVNLAALGQHQESENGERFADRKHAGDGVALPWFAARFVAMPSPEVDHAAAIGPHRNRLADLVAACKILLQGMARGFECEIAGAGYFNRHGVVLKQFSDRVQALEQIENSRDIMIAHGEAGIAFAAQFLLEGFQQFPEAALMNTEAALHRVAEHAGEG